LPIMGLNYQWNFGFVDPLNLIMWHNQYILVIIKQFSKWLELVPLLNHNNEGTTYTFFDRVFSWFGILVDVLTNKILWWVPKIMWENIDGSSHYFTKPS
jgi:hypothetical protein